MDAVEKGASAHVHGSSRALVLGQLKESPNTCLSGSSQPGSVEVKGTQSYLLQQPILFPLALTFWLFTFHSVSSLSWPWLRLAGLKHLSVWKEWCFSTELCLGICFTCVLKITLPLNSLLGETSSCLFFFPYYMAYAFSLPLIRIICLISFSF